MRRSEETVTSDVSREVTGSNPVPIPMALKRGLAAALSGFSEYALAKYRGEAKALKLL